MDQITLDTTLELSATMNLPFEMEPSSYGDQPPEEEGKIDRPLREPGEPPLAEPLEAEEAKLSIEPEDEPKKPKRKSKRSSKTMPMEEEETSIVEVDFYREPTVLSRLVLYQKYKNAMKRVHRKPEEAKVWVCSMRQLSEEQKAYAENLPEAEKEKLYSIRQLPLHIACSNLGVTLDSRVKSTLNQLIINLVVAYPEGCAKTDHNRNLPLHVAMWHGATPETVSMFLMAHPALRKSRDLRGWTLDEINQHRPGGKKRQMAEVLSLGPKFWVKAHEEAVFLLKGATVCWPSKDRKKIEPPTTSSTTSQDVATKLQAPTSNEEIAPIAWEQLEERAILGERLLTQMNETNYKLNQQLEYLARSQLKLMDKFNRMKDKDLVKEVDKLTEDNDKLNSQLFGMELLIRDHVMASDAQSESRKRRRRDLLLSLPPLRMTPPTSDKLRSSSKDSTDRKTLLRENKTLREQYNELNKTYYEQRSRIRHLETVIQALLEEEGENREDHVSSSSSQDETLSTTVSLKQTEVEPSKVKVLVSSQDVELSPPPKQQRLTRSGDDLGAVLHEDDVVQEEVGDPAPSDEMFERESQDLGPSDEGMQDTTPSKADRKKPSTASPLSPVDSRRQRRIREMDVPALTPSHLVESFDDVASDQIAPFDDDEQSI